MVEAALTSRMTSVNMALRMLGEKSTVGKCRRTTSSAGLASGGCYYSVTTPQNEERKTDGQWLQR